VIWEEETETPAWAKTSGCGMMSLIWEKNRGTDMKRSRIKKVIKMLSGFMCACLIIIPEALSQNADDALKLETYIRGPYLWVEKLRTEVFRFSVMSESNFTAACSSGETDSVVLSTTGQWLYCTSSANTIHPIDSWTESEVSPTTFLTDLSRNVGINTSNPLAKLHVHDDSVLFTGDLGGGDIDISGNGSRFLWYPGKASFRAGAADGTTEDLIGVWDDANISDFSYVFGKGNAARNHALITGNGNSEQFPNFTILGGSISNNVETTICGGKVSYQEDKVLLNEKN